MSVTCLIPISSALRPSVRAVMSAISASCGMTQTPATAGNERTVCEGGIRNGTF